MAPRTLAVVAGLLMLGCSDSSTGPATLHEVVIVAPDFRSFLVNDTARVQLHGRDQAGASYVAGPVRWRSTNPTVVSVDSLGLVVGRALGSAVIIGSVGDLSDSVTIEVAGTRHRWAITASETWTLAGSPHLVQGRLSVGRPFGTPATLTIEAGATVLFGDTSGLTFGLDGAGRLLAQGTPAAPIMLRDTAAAAVPGAWIGLTFRGANSSELHHVTMSGCGRARSDDQPRGCLVLGHRFGGPSPTVLLDDVTVQDAAGGAVVLQQDSRFAPGSAGLTVRRMRGHVATLAAAAAKDLPLGGTFTANDTNEVRLTRDTLREPLTLVSGIPWTIVEPLLVEGPLQPVLTIPAGVTVRMGAGAAIVVGKNAPGGLRIGTDGGPAVTLRQSTTTWGSIDFFPAALPSFMYDAVLESCGGFSDVGSGGGCVHIIGNFYGTAPAPTLKNVTIRNGSFVGVSLVGGGSFGAGSGNLTITGMTGPAFDFQASSPASTPTGQYAGNGPDPISVRDVQITRNETWRNLGSPYLINGLGVGHATNPTLTLDPGVILRFPPGSFLDVGGYASGNLRAIGTANAPVVFTGQFDHPGSWMGVIVGPFADATTVFEHVVVENAGADDGQFATGFRLAREMGPFIRNTVTRRSAGCGITRLSGSTWSTDFTAPALGNTFQDNVGPAQCGP